MYTGGSNSRLFNASNHTLEDIGRKISIFQTAVMTKLYQLEQSQTAFRMFFLKKIDESHSYIYSELNRIAESMAQNRLTVGTTEFIRGGTIPSIDTIADMCSYSSGQTLA